MSVPKDGQSYVFAKSFVAGGLAGMTSKTAIAPLDRIKILLQGHNAHYKSHGVMSGMKNIIVKEGFLGLYKGNGAMMVRVFPYAAMQFVSFEFYKKRLAGYFDKSSHLFKFVAGASAGVTAVVCTYPLDLVRARLAFQVGPALARVTAGANGNAVIQRSLGVFGTIVFIAKNEGGLIGLYRGLTPSICHIVPYAGCNFYAFERLKSFVLNKYPDVCGEKQGNQVALTVPSKLVCGGIAGSIAQTIAYPLDVCRRRMQLSMMSEETKKYGKNVFTTLVLTYKDHGVVRGLYRGMTANYLRVAPMMSVNFCAYELLKQMLGLQTGVATS